MKKVTLLDLAGEANVGTATVERVLNARGNVSPETAERVAVAARRLGHDRRLPEPYRGIIKIEVIMVRPDTPFFARLNDAFARIAASLDPSVSIHRTFLDELDPSEFARHIATPGFRRSGLIIAAPDHFEVKASLREAKASGVVVVNIVSPIGGDFTIALRTAQAAPQPKRSARNAVRSQAPFPPSTRPATITLVTPARVMPRCPWPKA
jgi:LacI family transcriptional regulator